MVGTSDNPDTARLLELLSSVVDPEIPVLTLQDLGVLRRVDYNDGQVDITITPTYSGCPAMDTMRADIEATLAEAGFGRVNIKTSLSPAWTTDWMSDDGRRKLRAYGIAPPARRSCENRLDTIECPQCQSNDVRRISEFGSTACKALYQCQECREPFDYFKCI